MVEMMANEPTTSAELELSEQDLLFNAYLDDDLSADEKAEFDERLDADPDFAQAWTEFADVMVAVRGLPFEFAPDNFVAGVQTRIRSRSRGRFFAEEMLFRTRMPYEVVCLVMIIVMAAAYLFMGAPPDAGMKDVNLPDAPPPLVE